MFLTVGGERYQLQDFDFSARYYRNGEGIGVLNFLFSGGTRYVFATNEMDWVFEFDKVANMITRGIAEKSGVEGAEQLLNHLAVNTFNVTLKDIKTRRYNGVVHAYECKPNRPNRNIIRLIETDGIPNGLHQRGSKEIKIRGYFVGLGETIVNLTRQKYPSSATKSLTIDFSSEYATDTITYTLNFPDAEWYSNFLMKGYRKKEERIEKMYAQIMGLKLLEHASFLDGRIVSDFNDYLYESIVASKLVTMQAIPNREQHHFRYFINGEKIRG